MNIIVDKINSEPGHSLSKKDLSIILNKLPFDYQGTIINFKLSAQMFDNSKWDRPVIYNNTTFNILSRGFSKNEIIRELLIEVFSQKDTVLSPATSHKLTNAQRKKLEEKIHPYLSDILQELNPIK